MGLWDNYKKRSEAEKEMINQATESLPFVEKMMVKGAMKVNVGSSPVSRLLGAVADTLSEKNGNK